MAISQLRRLVAATLLTTVAALLSGCSSEPEPRWLMGGPTMGTTWSVQLPTPPDGRTFDAVLAAIEAELRRINGLMSTYEPDSQLSVFNRENDSRWHAVDPHLVAVVAAAEKISILTAGVFDVTVAPLVRVWGFGGAKRPVTPPTSSELADLRDYVGFEKLHARISPAGLRKDDPRVQVDLSAIAKGFAVDRIADYLQSLGVSDYLVEIGGELRVGGENVDHQAWRVAIERPLVAAREAYRVITPGNAGIATSGDYRNFIDLDGQRYSHIIDPRDGRPVRFTQSLVTVVDETAMRADALATALIAMGPERGLEFANTQGIKALYVTRRGNDYRESASGAFLAAGY